MPELPYSESVMDSGFKVTWSQVTNAIRTYTWRAIMAKNDGEFNFHVNEMRKQCNNYGYDQCVEWSRGEAAAKWELTQQLAGK
jgi:multiple sugar transport system substrate-binding protein/putative aldouronate transport system substrate-binding protein